MDKFIKSASLAMILFAVANAAHASVVIASDLDDKVACHVPAVPEASTLSLMAVGLGLIGLRLRRKSK